MAAKDQAAAELKRADAEKLARAIAKAKAAGVAEDVIEQAEAAKVAAERKKAEEKARREAEEKAKKEAEEKARREAKKGLGRAAG